MIISHDFGIGIEEYEAKGKKNDFPVFDRCPDCQIIVQGNVHRNGCIGWVSRRILKKKPKNT